MYLFTRTATISPDHQLDGIAFAVEIAAKAAAVTGSPVSVYRFAFGAPLGTILWSSVYESHTALEAAEQKLMADAGYVEAITKASSLFTGPIEDALASPVITTIAAPHASYWATQASISGGKFAQALELGSSIANHIADVTGQPTGFFTDAYGPFGQVRWLTGADTGADMDKVRETLAVDPKFISLLESAGDCFAQGSGHSVLIHKVA